MASDWPIGVARTVTFRAFLASDGKTLAIGKTIAITISKNGATSFSNLGAGATNATEMASGFYKVTFATGDIDTAGPFSWRGAEGTINDVGDNFDIVDANKGKLSALPAAAAEAAGGLYTRGTGAGQLTQTANGELGIATLTKTLTTYTGNTVQTGDSFAVVNSGTHGNAALKTLVDDIPTNAELATSQAAADDATLAAIAALNNLSAAQVNTEVDTALVDIHLDHLLATTYDPASKPGAADALLNELVESDAGVSRYTANALEQAPTGGSAPSAADIADAVWDEATAGHTTSGTFGEQVKTDLDAVLADTNELQTDWVNGGRLDVILDARASQTSVDDLPTNAELAAAVPTASANATAVLAAATANPINSNIKEVNDVAIQGTGVTGDSWRPV